MKHAQTTRSAPCLRTHQTGFTLVELMVAMTIGLVITLAAIATLSMSRTGFTAADSTTQLRENARFATGLIKRIAMQAGYQDRTQTQAWTDDNIFGFNDGLFDSGATPVAANGNRTTGCTFGDLSCQNGSDVLIVRFQGSSPSTSAGVADGSIINCAGVPQPEVTVTGQRISSVFHVGRSAAGEPTLMCSSGVGANWVTVPLVQGIESLQVLYGIDDPANGVLQTPSGEPLNLADSYLRADQMTAANWTNVHSLRIGMVVRSAASTAVDRSAAALRHYFPLGQGYAAATDPGSDITGPNDGRVRLEITTTIHLRNLQTP